MNIHDLIQDGADEEFLDRVFFIERYAWLSLSYDMAAVIDIESCFTAVNLNWERSTGYIPNDLQGNYLMEFMHFDDREQTLAQLQKMITSDLGTTSFVFNFRCKDGSFKRFNWNVVYSPEHNQFFCVVRDVSTVDKEAVMRYAYKDALTGLNNRLYLTDCLPDILARAATMGWKAATLFIDLDGFKQVNDTYGHASGDELLVEVAKRLTSCLTEQDTLFRLGGDEFLAILGGNANRKRIKQTAADIVHTLPAPFRLGEHEVSIGASVGISLYPEDSTNGDELLECADRAMYHVKKTGKNRFQFFDQCVNDND